MLNDEVGEVDAESTEGQDPSGIDIQEQPAEEEDANVSEDAKTQDQDSEAEEEADKKSSKPEPFHKHPAFQRMTRKNAKLAAQNEALTEQVSEMSNLMKEMIALQKGEEFKPEPKVDNAIPDAQELLDMEMEKLLQAEDLSSDEEQAVIKIAQKYKTDIGDGKAVFLPAKTALQIYRDSLENSGAGKRSVSTKPSSGAAEANVGKGRSQRKPAKSIAEAVWRAKQELAKQSKVI